MEVLKRVRLKPGKGSRKFRNVDVSGYIVRFDADWVALVPEKIAKLLCTLPAYELVEEKPIEKKGS